MSNRIFEQEVLPLFERHRADYLGRARTAALRLADKGKGNRVITVNDVRKVCPPPPHLDGRMMGGIFARRSEWMPVRYGPSDRRVSHGRPVAQFVFIGRQMEFDFEST